MKKETSILQWLRQKTLTAAGIRVIATLYGERKFSFNLPVTLQAQKSPLFTLKENELFTLEIFVFMTLKYCWAAGLSQFPKDPDVLISESTYGGKVRPPRNELVNQLLKQLLLSMKHKGNVLIPTFAFHRSQEMAKRIDSAIEAGILPSYNVYTVSNLANRITRYYNQNKPLFTKEIKAQNNPFNYRHVKHVFTTAQIDEPAIVICTAGFGHAGASLRLLADWGSSKANSVIVTSGYLPPDSPLKSAMENHYFKTADGETVSIKADVQQIELSGHADQLELIQLIAKVKPQRTLLVHGDIEQAEALKEKIGEMTDVCIPERNEVIDA